MSIVNNLSRTIFLSVVSLAIASASFASPVVKARLDSANVMMGSLSTLELTVDQEKSVKGHFPLFRSVAEKGYVQVCGDSVELRAPAKIDTVAEGDRLKIRYEIPVQSFDSGSYRLPQIEFVVGVDTFRSNAVQLQIFPFPNVTADTPIAEYANVAEPEGKTIFDSLPDWLVKYWWIWLVIIVLTATGIWVWRKYRKDGHILPKKPEPTPYEVATGALASLKEKKLWENGMEKEYFTELTDILRNYLYGRFGINAMEMTSRQILSALSANPEIKDKKPMIRQILDMADYVKFAKVRPLPADNIASFDNALKFVEDTKPAQVDGDRDSSSENGKMDEKEKKGGEK